nr:MAG TPA: hypothetical protein [Caudoviricetes sp.]
MEGQRVLLRRKTICGALRPKIYLVLKKFF